MTALSTRDALAKALFAELEPMGEGWSDRFDPAQRDAYRSLADHLFASGAVVDAASLVTEERVTAVARAWFERERPPFGPVTEWDDLSAVEQWRWRQSTCDNLTALIAVLTERGGPDATN